MAVNPIYGDSTYAAGVYKAPTPKAEETKAAEEEKQIETNTTDPSKVDTFEKTTYTADWDKINSMKSDLNNNISAFRQMVQGLFQSQGNFANSAMQLLLNIDEETQAKAKAAIAEDGEWGVENTANRILDFAKALSGGDPSKIELLRGAVEKGFGAAEKIWGGELPGISYQTYDRIMQGFDDWANETAKPGETVTEE